MFCKVEGCEKLIYLKGKRYGFCQMHLRRFQRHGDPNIRLYVEGGRNCEVSGCKNKINSGSLCRMHLHRLQRHGDVHTTINIRNKGNKCGVNDCNLEAFSKGFCQQHYSTVMYHGREHIILRPDGEGTITKDGYRLLTINDRRMLEHVMLAEQALGRPLPEGAVVHHMNGDGLDNYTPFNLIICPNQAYHMLLHKRMRDSQNRSNS